MIPACLSSLYLTPSSALFGLPPVIAEAQSCTDHFILWDKTSLLASSQSLGEQGRSSKTQTSKAATPPQVTHMAARALLLD